MKLVMLMLSVMVLSVAVSNAGLLPLQNPSFEEDNIAPGASSGYYYDVVGWTDITTHSFVYNSTPADAVASMPVAQDGSQYLAKHFGEMRISQVVPSQSHTIVQGYTYTVTVYVSRRPYYEAGFNYGIHLFSTDDPSKTRFDSGSTTLMSVSQTTRPVAYSTGGYYDPYGDQYYVGWTKVTFDYTATAADAGKLIGIELQKYTYTSNFLVTFDNVSISYVVPEPATIAMLGLGSLLTLKRRQ